MPKLVVQHGERVKNGGGWGARRARAATGNLPDSSLDKATMHLCLPSSLRFVGAPFAGVDDFGGSGQ